MNVVAQIVTPKARDGSLRIAFATKDCVTVNDHFGWTRTFMLYDVTSSKASKAGKIVFSAEGLDERGNDDKLAAKIEALAGCHIVYSRAIGGPAAARLTRRSIHPIVVPEDEEITGILEKLKTLLGGNLPPWLKKLTGTKDPERFAKFEEEE